jgi:gamma-glutamylcyclotransferase
MAPLYYLAYGSNLHPLRLMQRVSSAKVEDVIELPGRQGNFHKRSPDGSGKCNLTDEGVSS